MSDGALPPSDDLLRRAARALREREGGDEPSGRSTKAEVLRALAPPARGSPARRPRHLVLALAAALALSTAWAAAVGRLPALRRAVAVAVPPAPIADDTSTPGGVADGPRATDDGPPDAPPSTEDGGPEGPPIADRGVRRPSAPRPEPAPPVSAHRRTGTPSAGPAPATAATAATAGGAAAPSIVTAPSADELYEQAHRAHFSGRDPAAALAAWDRYLTAAPRGRFALEARYNRALALSRLGRRDEAARALEPFAAGDFGGYRQSEARRLLLSLRGAPD